jgi:hypothetical protein
MTLPPKDPSNRRMEEDRIDTEEEKKVSTRYGFVFSILWNHDVELTVS